MIGAVFVAAIATALASILLLRVLYSWVLPNPLPNIPHNPITSVLGDIPTMAQYTKDGKGNFTEFLVHFTGIHGPISQILLLWHRIVIVTDRSEAERIMLAGKTVDTSERLRAIFATALPNSQISLPTNETWKKHRRLTGPSMSKRYLERMSGRIFLGANELVGLWRAKHALVGRSAFDVAFDFHLATMDTIVNITLGESIGCIKSAHNALPPTYCEPTNIAHLPRPEPPLLYTAGNMIAEGFDRALQTPIPRIAAWLFTRTSPTWWKYYNLMTSFLTDAVTRARERVAELERAGQELSTNADCVLDMVVQRETQGGMESLSDKDILDELATYVFAGQGTTASALTWLVKYLPTDPEIQRRLHEEMCAVFGADVESNQPLDFNHLDDSGRVPILEAVVAETMRCANVAALISRELVRDEVILNRFVPKGTQLIFTTGLMSKDITEWGPDADVWRPSRWLTPDGAFNRLAGPSIPFGMGQRSCFGQRLAIFTLKTYLATISRVFYFNPVPPEVNTWEAVEMIIRQPKLNFVSLDRWDLKSES